MPFATFQLELVEPFVMLRLFLLEHPKTGLHGSCLSAPSHIIPDQLVLHFSIIDGDRMLPSRITRQVLPL